MKRQTIQKLFCALLTILACVLTGSAKAQPVGTPIYSLEAKVALAQSVVCGTITNYSECRVERPSGADVRQESITVQVAEVIKGSPVESIRLVSQTPLFVRKIDECMLKRSTMLFFIGDDGGDWRLDVDGDGGDLGKSNRWNAMCLDTNVSMNGGKGGDSVFSVERWAWLEDSQEIISRARKAANEQSSGQIKVERIPWDSNPMNSLLVPVLPYLETVAKRMIEKPEEYARKDQ